MAGFPTIDLRVKRDLFEQLLVFHGFCLLPRKPPETNVLDISLCIYYHVSTHAQLIRNAVKTAKVFTHGNSQAVRLPKEFRFEDSEVIIRKVGESILLTPKKHRWKNLEASLSLFEGKIERNQPTEIEIREWPWQ